MASGDKGLEDLQDSMDPYLAASSSTFGTFPRCREAKSAHPLSTAFADSPKLGQIESNYDEITDSFDSMNLKSELLRGKRERKYDRETTEARLTDQVCTHMVSSDLRQSNSEPSCL